VEANDPWVTCEQLMPVLPIVRVADFDSALALALRVEEGLHHTAIMHSQNVSRLNLAARTLQTSILSKMARLTRESASAAKGLPPSPSPRQPEKAPPPRGRSPACGAAC
jgi:acyl-CoA reductase-like NAD-dependent aldehyde dehydrogenase